jgi:hypothetical protein
MNREFSSLKELGQFLRARYASPQHETEAIEAGLEAAVILLEEEAVKIFGHYPENGEWPELSDTTKRLRESAGYAPNRPLLVTGNLRDSVSHRVSGRSAEVGSASEIMLWQEKGTSRTGWSPNKGIPPRPVFLITQHNHMAEAVAKFFMVYIENLRGI